MKKIVLSIFLSFLLILPVFGATTDYSRLNLKSSLCAVESTDLHTIQLFSQKKELTNKEIDEIKKIIKKIKISKNVCKEKIAKTDNIKNVYPLLSEKELNSCIILDLKKEAITHYFNILNFNQQDLTNKGYINKEEIEEIIKIINKEITEIKPLCKTKRIISNFTAPFFTNNAFFINNYFKNETINAINNTTNYTSFLSNFKKINNIVDILTKDYLINNEEIYIENILPFITEFTIVKGKIFLQNQEFTSNEQKTFNFGLNDKNIKIINQKNSSTLIFKNIKINIKIPFKFFQEKIIVNTDDISSPLELFLENIKNNKGEFSLSKNTDDYTFIQGTLFKTKRILGIFSVNIPIKQTYYFINDAFILQNENKPFWSIFAF